MKIELDAATEKRLHEELKQRLLEMGLLSEIKPPLPLHAIPRDRKPFPVDGNSVSELLIKERR